MRTASEVLRNLEYRLARLERKASDSLSPSAQGMMQALANHSRTSKMPSVGNLNHFQEVLTVLGYGVKTEDSTQVAQRQEVSDLINRLYQQLPSLYPNIDFNRLSLQNDQHTIPFRNRVDNASANSAVSHIIRTHEQDPNISVSRSKPKSIPFGKIAFVFDPSKVDVFEVSGSTYVQYDVSYLEGVKNLIVSSGSSKVKLTLSITDSLQSFDLSKLIAFVVKEGGVEKAKSYLGSSFVDTTEKPTLRADEGTCPGCFQVWSVNTGNKMIRKHGYKIIRNWTTSTGCLGTGFPPVEDSVEGLQGVKRLMEDTIKEKRSLKLRLELEAAREEVLTVKSEKLRKAGVIENHIHSLELEIKHYDARIGNWNPSTRG